MAQLVNVEERFYYNGRSNCNNIPGKWLYITPVALT